MKNVANELIETRELDKLSTELWRTNDAHLRTQNTNEELC